MQPLMMKPIRSTKTNPKSERQQMPYTGRFTDRFSVRCEAVVDDRCMPKVRDLLRLSSKSSVLCRDSLNRQLPRQLHLLHRNIGLHRLNTFDAGQVLHLEFPVCVQVFGDDAKQEVTITCHQVTLDDFS